MQLYDFTDLSPSELRQYYTYWHYSEGDLWVLLPPTMDREILAFIARALDDYHSADQVSTRKADGQS